MKPFYWELFSKKLREKLDRLAFVGFFTQEIAKAKGMRLAVGQEGSLCFYWLVDETDGVIADVKFQAFGPIGLIAAAESLSELMLRKNYDQASRLTVDLIDQHVRDKKEIPAFPKECDPFLNQALSAMDQAVSRCIDLPFEASHDVTPIESDFGELPGGIPGFEDLPHSQKVHIVKEVLDREIRPYIALDAGDVTLVELKETLEVLISYEGACTSCPSSTGSTLSAIQKILRARVHPSLIVVPVIG